MDEGLSLFRRSNRIQKFIIMQVDFRNFFKSLETLIVFGGVILSIMFGNFWLIPMLVGYTLVNVPNAWRWVKSLVK